MYPTFSPCLPLLVNPSYPVYCGLPYILWFMYTVVYPIYCGLTCIKVCQIFIKNRKNRLSTFIGVLKDIFLHKNSKTVIEIYLF